MKNNAHHTILKIRLVVGYLGERAQCDWWPTKFYEASSKPFLEPVFSKTSQLTQYHSVLEAARRLHDEHLSVGCYHLFRLPEEVEQDLHNLVQLNNPETLAGLDMSSKDAAMISLGKLADGVSSKSVGPTAVGSIDELDSTKTAKAIAAAYLSAFTQNAKTYPYLLG